MWLLCGTNISQAATVFEKHATYSPLQLVVARDALKLVFELGLPDSELLKMLLVCYPKANTPCEVLALPKRCPGIQSLCVLVLLVIRIIRMLL